ncbi:pentapeptide repeat-containing protein [Nonomuraea angiospora]|uniref:pentapeptide repeat-containing protein n=1 Tax=Nonomuraea angiospora TaxID=46172 RepID=UPI00344D1652
MTKKPIAIVVAMIGGALVAWLVWMMGPGARWVLENIDGVPIGGATGLTGKDLAAALDAVRGRVLAVATGLAALLAVFYTARNADTARRTFQLGEHGHVTDRYGKAVEQLGSAQAPVRLGGLYALEQLAQDTPDPEFRQTIVDVICAYLRMPYTPPAEQHRRENSRASAAHSSEDRGRDPHEERQVRLTAQRILATHLRYQLPPSRRWWRPPGADFNPRHWPNIRLDLTGATLLDFDFDNCRVGDAAFSEATFTGNTSFDEGTFTGSASFGGATFTGNAWFGGATFTHGAWFDRGAFTGSAWFSGVTFTGPASFRGTTITGPARFLEATFTGTALFNEATFTMPASFEYATFAGSTSFDHATFTDSASFGKATFAGRAGAREATGLEAAVLDGVRVLTIGSEGKRRWPAAWEEVQDSSGERTLRLVQPPADSADENVETVEPGGSGST